MKRIILAALAVAVVCQCRLGPRRTWPRASRGRRNRPGRGSTGSRSAAISPRRASPPTWRPSSGSASAACCIWKSTRALPRGRPISPVRCGANCSSTPARRRNRLGLQINMNNDAGWCGSGGPWITPELSMQRVVWTETVVTGPKAFAGPLARPEAVQQFLPGHRRAGDAGPGGQGPHPRHPGQVVRHTAALSAAAGRVRVRCPPDSVIPRDRDRRFDGQDGRRRQAHLGRSRRASGSSCASATPRPARTIIPRRQPGRGLECDKLSKEATEVHFNGLMGRLIAENRALAGKGKTLVSTHIDSWESGLAKLDAPHARGVPEAPRLRPPAAAADLHRPRGR